MPIDTASLMKQVARIRMLTTKRVDARFCGEYHSVFKGQGIEFDEVRPYVAGDDVRNIDWNVTARTGEPHIKRYAEERELTVVFMVDVSGSQIFGSGDRAKAELAAEAACVLALSAIRNQDKIGLVLFADRVLRYLAPRKGRTAVMRLVREVLAAEPRLHRGTDLAGALRFFNAVQRRRAILFVISDFLAPNFERELRACARRHDVIALPTADAREFDLPKVGLIELDDPETGARVTLDTASARVRRLFRVNGERHRESLRRNFARHAIDSVFLDTGQPSVDAIHHLFRRRMRRMKGGR